MGECIIGGVGGGANPKIAYGITGEATGGIVDLSSWGFTQTPAVVFSFCRTGSYTADARLIEVSKTSFQYSLGNAGGIVYWIAVGK